MRSATSSSTGRLDQDTAQQAVSSSICLGKRRLDTDRDWIMGGEGASIDNSSLLHFSPGPISSLSHAKSDEGGASSSGRTRRQESYFTGLLFPLKVHASFKLFLLPFNFSPAQRSFFEHATSRDLE